MGRGQPDRRVRAVQPDLVRDERSDPRVGVGGAERDFCGVAGMAVCASRAAHAQEGRLENPEELVAQSIAFGDLRFVAGCLFGDVAGDVDQPAFRLVRAFEIAACAFMVGEVVALVVELAEAGAFAGGREIPADEVR